MFEYRPEHIMSYVATLGKREQLGPVPEGLRVNVHVTGGEVTGPKVFGTFSTMGGDWFTVRRDGVVILDVRATIETRDGALIYMTYNGTSDLGKSGYEQIVTGALPVQGRPIRMSPRFQTSHPNYIWLNRIHCFGVGHSFPEKSEVAYDVYAIR